APRGRDRRAAHRSRRGRPGRRGGSCRDPRSPAGCGPGAGRGRPGARPRCPAARRGPRRRGRPRSARPRPRRAGASRAAAPPGAEGVAEGVPEGSGGGGALGAEAREGGARRPAVSGSPRAGGGGRGGIPPDARRVPAELVVELALLLVGEDLEGLVDLLELLL